VVGDRVSDGMASVDDGGDVGGDSVADNSSVANVGDVGHLSRGSGSKAEEGRDRKGLHFCSISRGQLVGRVGPSWLIYARRWRLHTGAS